jgi:energy-coupling factor transport system ATP-binding protein
VLAERGAELAAAGVWVPGREPAGPNLPPPTGDPLLATRSLVVGRDRTPLRTAPDLTLDAGSLVALAGPNGSGKTTLALTLAGLLPPVAGRVEPAPALAAGLTGPPIRWRSRDLLTRIAMVLQSPQHSFLTARVRDELAVGLIALRRPEPERIARVDELLERLDLAALADANPFTLSGGQQRRLSVGGALAAAPRLVILDEPTFGQDARTWAALVGLLAEAVVGGSAVLAVTHDPGLLKAATSRVDLAPAGARA